MVCGMVEGNREIIVVDDDTGSSRAIERLLLTSGWQARSFGSAEEFLDSDRWESAVFLILDIHLPGMSGFDLHQRREDQGLSCPAIFITGHDRPSLRERALKAGAVAYLTKPFAGQLLIDAMRPHLDAA